MYADYEFYTKQYSHKDSGQIPEQDFMQYADLAAARMEYITQGKITLQNRNAEHEVKLCCCAIAEALYKYDKATDNASAAPVASWSNDGESGSYDLSNSAVTEVGLNHKIMRAARTYLWKFGVLYRGCC